MNFFEKVRFWLHRAEFMLDQQIAMVDAAERELDIQLARLEALGVPVTPRRAG